MTSTQLVVFDEVKAEIAKYKVLNASLIFDYEDIKGNADARSHIFKLRKTKTKITAVHKDAKSEALAVCKMLDGEKRDLIEAVEEMISVHAIPIQEIEDKKRKEIEDKIEAERVEKERLEQERLTAMAKQEAALAVKEAELNAKQEAIDRAEREKKIAEEAADNTRKQARAKAVAKENAEKAKQARLLEIERKRVENTKHREKIEDDIHSQINQIINDDGIADRVVEAIKNGLIANLKIIY